ncbi:hypothetical protein F8M41_005329 [Gigaspora margarita]|uniref:Uncharacterized protein n=1 Tax=Gigaspora margarita TaxID=4874 RepID=A0A8H3X911_GIGMA|nr:hypothetical protein F8M41_005329 [Gigaspora margarita]
MQPKKRLESSLLLAKDININTSVAHNIDQLPDSNVHDQNAVELDDDIILQEKTNDFEEIQSNKRKNSNSVKLNKKEKQAKKQ